jgi:hypothetical protein
MPEETKGASTPLEDAKACRKAMKGLGTNEKLLIATLADKTHAEVQAISVAFQGEFKRDLLADVLDETSGDLQEAFKGVVMLPGSYAAQQLHSTDTRLLSEILCTSDQALLNAAQDAYEVKFKKALRVRLTHKIDQPLRAVYLNMIDGKRESAGSEAVLETHVTDINRVLKNKKELDRKLVQYVSGFDRTHAEALRTKFLTQLGLEWKDVIAGCSGDELAAALTYAVLPLPVVFGNELLDAFGFKKTLGGLDERKAIRIIMTHKETILPEINKYVFNRSQKTISQWVSTKFGGITGMSSAGQILLAVCHKFGGAIESDVTS